MSTDISHTSSVVKIYPEKLLLKADPEKLLRKADAVEIAA